MTAAMWRHRLSPARRKRSVQNRTGICGNGQHVSLPAWILSSEGLCFQWMASIAV